MYRTTLILHAVQPYEVVELKISKTTDGKIDLWLSDPSRGKVDCRLNQKEIAQILAIINS